MRFPENFLWGTATAAYQVEGAGTKTAAARPFGTRSAIPCGKVVHGDTGDTACDQYNRLEEDLDLCQSSGCRHTASPLPGPASNRWGAVPANQNGLDFYPGSSTA